MTPEDQMLEEEVIRGKQADEILNNPLWQEACEHWKSDLMRQLKSLTSHPEACQQVAQLLVAGERWEGFIKNIADTGKMARIQLDQ